MLAFSMKSTHSRKRRSTNKRSLKLKSRRHAMNTVTEITQSPPAIIQTPTTPQLGRPVRAPEPLHEIDTESINNQLHVGFSTSLVSALEAASRGELTQATEPTLIFTTVYKPLPTGPELTQYWTAFMGDGYPEPFTAYDLLSPEGDSPNIKKLTDAITAFKNVDASCLHFIPLTGNKVNPTIPLYSQIRGNKNDKTPFVIYTKNLGRVYAHLEDGHFAFHSMDGAILTPHQQRTFNKWFGEQLAGYVTPELLSSVFSTSAAEFLYRATDISGCINQLNAIKIAGRQITETM